MPSARFRRRAGRAFLFICLLLAPGVLCAPAVCQADLWTLQVNVKGRRYTGAPLQLKGKHCYVLQRDGQMVKFDSADAADYEKTSGTFRAYDYATMRGALMSEFGNQFEVSGAGQYLVVHPAGERNKWASRFASLYRSFMYYFGQRGFTPAPPAFPLVAVVFRNRQQFVQYSLRSGNAVRGTVLGYYSPMTNRILMYDITAGDPRKESQWAVTAETIIHEAAHQTAFNTGIHGRFAEQPRWVVEGLGTLFEARGVWNARQHPEQQDRVNVYRRKAFRKYAANWRRGLLAELVSSDRMFKQNADAAYAIAWATTFYLSETSPRRYTAYLKKVASRPVFTVYNSPQRLADFQQAFGNDLNLLEANMLRYMKKIE